MYSALEPVKNLVGRVTEQVAVTLLSSSIVFPRTESLVKNQPLILIEADHLDIEDLKRTVQSHPKLSL
jgi:hypothetical protein